MRRRSIAQDAHACSEPPSTRAFLFFPNAIITKFALEPCRWGILELCHDNDMWILLDFEGFDREAINQTIKKIKNRTKIGECKILAMSE